MFARSLKAELDSINALSATERGVKMTALSAFLKTFTCERDLDIQRFLTDSAINYDTKHRARTYLLLEDDLLVGYYTVTIKNIVLRARVPQKTRAKLTYGMTDTDTVPAYLIAQIGKNDSFKRPSVIGEILGLVLGTIERASAEVGGRVVYLECKKDNERLHNVYEANGFSFLQDTEKYKQFVMITK